MLIGAKLLQGCTVVGVDDTVGTVKDVLFDADTWAVRYFEVDTGKWLYGRRVILAPSVIDAAEYTSEQLATSLSRQQVLDSPSILEDMPVSRQKEAELATHYAWGTYWMTPPGSQSMTESGAGQNADPNLRTTHAVSGYSVKASDGDIGHVDEFIIDDSEWRIRYLVIDTRNWLPGRKVVIAPEWTKQIEWESRSIHADLPRESIKNSPEFNPQNPVNRRCEEVLCDYYGRPKYWEAWHEV